MLSSDVEAYDAYCDRTAPDACPICGTDCRCDGPHELVDIVRSASSLSQLTPALGRDDERDAEVCEPNTIVQIDGLGPMLIVGRRIQADPRLAAIADQLAASILATLEAHGYAIVREADTQGYDEQRNRDFAREAARNAAGILGMEGVL